MKKLTATLHRGLHHLDIAISLILEKTLKRLPIGWLQLRHNKTRLFAAIGGVAFASLLVLMQLGFLGALVGSIALPYKVFDAQILISASDMNTIGDADPVARARLLQAATIPGIKSVTPVYLGLIDWRQPDGTLRSLTAMGFEPSTQAFKQDAIIQQQKFLTLADTVLIDANTQNIDTSSLLLASPTHPWRLEIREHSLNVLGHFKIGGGFASDGYMLSSDQTFLRLFQNRSAGAPNLGLVKLEQNVDSFIIIQKLHTLFNNENDVKVRTIEQAIKDDQHFNTTQRPVGVIFGFGVIIGLLVGIVIVYQVLASDVADHLKEYATLKAIGYPNQFFLSIIFEEAVILGLLGFIPGLLIAIGLYNIVGSKTGLPMEMTTSHAILVLIGTIIMCTLAGSIATRRLTHANPADLY